LKVQRAAQRALQAEAQAHRARRKRLMLAMSPVVVVIVVIGILVGVKLSSTAAANKTKAASASITKQVTSVPLSVLNTVGAGTASGPTHKLTGDKLTKDNLPRLLYVGAEWCPYCAAERWPLAVAVSRFGTLTGLGETASSPTDTDPNTATLSFHGSKYTSKTLAFSPIELEDDQHQPLDKLDSADGTLFQSIGGSAYPFIDVGGVYQFGVQYSPDLLAGKTHDEIAQAVHDPTTDIATAAAGAANVLTAAICTLTDNKPATVCTSSGVKAAAALLASATAATTTAG
jgi:type II secretory pathway pseudopilin PulG